MAKLLYNIQYAIFVILLRNVYDEFYIKIRVNIKRNTIRAALETNSSIMCPVLYEFATDITSGNVPRFSRRSFTTAIFLLAPKQEFL